MHLSEVLFAIALALTLICGNHELSLVAAQAGGPIFYKIPDPFWNGEATNKETTNPTGYFFIQSFQCTISSHRKKTQTEVEEYFSLTYGLTYSLHKNRDDRSQAFAIIGDGSQGKSYIVRNPNTNEMGEIDCELDHLHHHRQVFPWQYVYETNKNPNSQSNSSSSDSTSNNQKKRRNRKNKKNRWTNKRFIYGIGAIWMNAIQRQVVSNEIGDDSPFPGSNLWVMREADLEIKLLFDKPQEWPSEESGRQRLLAASPLGSIQMRRQNVLEPDQEMGGMNSVDESVDIISVQSFKRDVSVEDPMLRRFFNQLSECRRQTRKHRLFPSLTRAVSISPQRLYALEYVERKFGPLMVDETKASPESTKNYDKKHHRVLRNTELHTEWFSFKHEAQVDVYEPTDTFKGSFYTFEEQLADVFIKRFSDRESQRSSRHSTVSYHIKELGGDVQSCVVGEQDPLPKWFNLMIRQIHLRRPNGNSLSGLITGVGALLMNAADIHYKQFNLFKRTINALYDPMNLLARRKVTVDEWQLTHHPTGRVIHFYFEEKKDANQRQQQHEINDLVRIDIRDSKARDKDDDAIEDASVDNGENDADMLMRFEIISFDLDKDIQSAEFMFTPPEQCFSNNTKPKDDESSNDSDDQEEQDFNQEEDKFPSDTEEEHDPEDEEEQEEGEDFEFEPGKFMESFQFPDFYDFFEDQVAYKIVYSIELLSEDEDAEEKLSSKRIHLIDSIDTETNLAKHEIFYSQQALNDQRPDLEFYIDYNMEIMFKKHGDSSCYIVDDLDPWFRLLSAKLNYYRTLTTKASVSVQSNRLRSYGLSALWRLASLSEYSYFLGMKKIPLIMADKCEYREVSWGLEDDNDSDYLIEFRFLWNVTQFNVDSAFGTTRRPNDLLSLHSLNVLPYPDTEVKSLENIGFKDLRIPDPISINYLENNSFSLPQICLDSMKDRRVDDESQKMNELAVKLPSFWDFISSTNTYSATYFVSHAPQYEENVNQTAQSISITRISEHVDRNANLGKLILGIGEETRIIFIDDNRKTIYSFMPATGICNRIASISGLINMITGLQEQRIDLQAGKMFGLANLWVKMSLMRNLTLSRVTFRHDTKGNKFEVRNYGLTKEADDSESNNKPISYDLRVTFVAAPQQVQQQQQTFNKMVDNPQGREFWLENVDFIPRYTKSFSGRTPLHRTTIHVQSITSNSTNISDFQLPDECITSHSEDFSDNPTPSPALDFPKISSLLQATNQFSMRSEITSSTISFGVESESDKKLYIMDEWYYSGDVHLKSYGLLNDFNLIIFSATKESFDISTPYKCFRTLPKLFQSAARIPDQSLLEFWAGEKAYVSKLNSLFYGPLSLWRQAELNVGQLKLVSSLELAPLPTEMVRDIDYLEREMRTEVWRLSSPDISAPWSYDLYFERFMNKETKRQWHVLRSIQVYDVPNDPNVKVLIEAEIINYRYNHTDRELISRFILPEGYHCNRDASVIEEMRKTGDDLNVDWNLEHQFWYEASLELITDGNQAFEDPELGSLSGPDNLVLPTATGLVIRSSKLNVKPANIDLYVHYKKSHYINGTITSTRTVYDQKSSLIYIMDQKTGFCGIGQDQGQISDWIIEFPTGDQNIQYIRMNSKMMDLLFKQTKDYYIPLERYTKDGFVFSVYEHTINTLPKQTSLEGPATIIRKFQHPLGDKMIFRVDGTNSIKMHNSISVKMLLFDSTRSKVQAILNISLRGVSNIGITELVKYINVAQCYNDGDELSDRQVRTFSIEYRCSSSALKGVKTRITSTTRDFLINLMELQQLLPTQFYDSPRLEFVSRKRFRFTFSLIEAPTAIEYATRRLVESRMSLELESKSEMMLVSSLLECSNWCDKVGCVALTYCSDHTCRILTPNMMHEKSANETLTPKDLSDLFASVQDPDCTYFIWASTKPSKLDTFSSSMDKMINQPNGSSDPMSLTVFGSYFETVKPLKFMEITDNLDLFDEDSSSLSTNNQELSSEYKILWYNQKLDHHKLEQLVNKEKFKFTLDYTHNQAECLESCQKDPECIMISYCKVMVTCQLVSGKGDIKTLEPALEHQEPAAGCMVLGRDLLTKYTQFKDTLKPANYKFKFDNYSALECAAICNQYDGTVDDNDGSGEKFKCLSFDSCGSGESKSEKECYLQSMHVMLDSFDRSILAPKWHDENQQNSRQQPVCEHYSKSVLFDFKQIKNRQVAQEEKQIVRGSSLDQCAIECREDEQCQAFEYCFDDTRQPIQSCYFIRMLEFDDGIEKSLNFSEKCSIYSLEHLEEKYKIDTESFPTVILDAARRIATGSYGFLHYLVIGLSYMFLALLVGSAIQIIYIRLFGLPIEVNHRIL